MARNARGHHGTYICTFQASMITELLTCSGAQIVYSQALGTEVTFLISTNHRLLMDLALLST